MSTERAIEELKRCSGTQFDPQIVETFVEILKTEDTNKADASIKVKHTTLFSKKGKS